MKLDSTVCTGLHPRWGCLGLILSLTVPTILAKSDWVPVGICGGGALFAPAISPANPKVMMVNCDMSGAYISRDGGVSWTMIDGRQLRASTRCRPAFHPTDPRMIFAAQSGAGLKVSRDGGILWSPVPTPAIDLCGEIRLDPTEPNQMLIGDDRGVYRSADGGGHWEACPGVHGISLGFHFDQSGRNGGERSTFAATTAGVWRSDDSGLTWSLKSSQLGSRLLSFCGGSNVRDQSCRLYVSIPSEVVGGSLKGGVYRSTDRGETWESCMSGGINVETHAFDPWAHGPVAQYPWVLTCDANPDIIWAFNSNTGVPPPHHSAAYRSSDSGRSWKPTFFPDPRFPGFNCDREFMTTVEGQYFQGIPLGVAIDPSDGEHVVQVDSSYCYETTNGGRTWRSCSSRYAGLSGQPPEPSWTANGLVVTTTWNYFIDPFQSFRRYIGYTDVGFARSSDSGASWIWWSKSGRSPWGNTCYDLAFDPEVPGKLWGAFSDSHDIPNYNAIGGGHRTDQPGGVCVSTNFGANWSPANHGLPNHGVLSVVVDPHSPTNQRTLYASVYADGVYQSTDGGGSWHALSEGLPDPGNRRVCRLQLHRNGDLFVLVTGKKLSDGRWADDAGLYRSHNRAGNWEKVNRTHPFHWPKDFTVDAEDGRIIYLGAADSNGEEQGGLWRTLDGGLSWNRILRKGPEHFGAFLHPRHRGWIYATLTEGAPGAGLWLSQDDGKSWHPMNLPFTNAQRVTVDPAEESTIYVSTFGGGVWKGPASE